MIITGKRIRSVERRLAGVPPGQGIILGLSGVDRFRNRLEEVGLPDPPDVGYTILPAAVGPVSKYNAEGKEIVHRDRAMETAFRQVEWHWTEWHGRDRVEKSDICDVPYQRYPRTFVPPPSVELTVAEDTNGQRVIVTPGVVFAPENHEWIAHVVNLLLELFGECHVMYCRLMPGHQPKIRRVNWTILPKGNFPWPKLQERLKPIVDREPEGNRPVIWYRLQAVEAYGPEFVAVGHAGFQGYLGFAFPDRGLYIFECTNWGNATYVFGDNWETLSQLTKAQILSEGLQKARLVHREGWEAALHKLFT